MVKCGSGLAVATKTDLRYSQSKHRDKDIALCEVQLQLYLTNMYALPAMVGFLVQVDGMCRTCKATRKPESMIMHEQSDLVHVSHIAEVLRVLWEDGGLDT